MTGISVLFIVLAFLGSLTLALIPYFKKDAAKRPKHWIWLALLRFVAIFATAVLLINPKITRTHYSLEKKDLVLAVDNSLSIQNLQADSSVQRAVGELKNNAELRERFEVQSFSFGENFKTLDSLNFDENQTDISQVPSNLEQLYNAKDFPVIVISDGNQTLGQDYEYAFKNNDAQVYPVVAGDTTQYIDYRIDRVNVNKYAFLENKFPVEIFINRNTNRAEKRRVTINKGDREVFSKKLNFDKNQKSAVVKAILKADNVGVQTYTAQVETSDREKNTENNKRRFALEVIDQQTKILLAASVLHPDLGSFKKSIENNEQRQVDIKLVQDLNLKELDLGQYQLVLRYQPTRNFEKLDKQIENLALNTLTIHGQHSNYAYENKRQNWYHKSRSRQKESYFPVLNADFNAFQIENFTTENLPPLKDKFGGIEFKSQFQPLLFQKVKGVETETPMLATREINKRREAVLFGENSWRWRAKSFREHGNFEVYDEFTGKLIQYLSSDKARERLIVDYKSFYKRGDKIILKARYFDKNYKFDPRGDLFITLENRETDRKKRLPFILKNNHYQVDLSNLSAGKYKFQVGVKDEQLKKGGQFTVLNFEVEKQFLNADKNKMQAIASDKLFYPDKIKELVNDLVNNKKYRSTQRAETKESPLINWIYLLFVIIGCLATEWFVRKYKGLT